MLLESSWGQAAEKKVKLISGNTNKVLDRQSEVLLDSNLLSEMCKEFRLYLKA
jgi:hypothetical protein